MTKPGKLIVIEGLDGSGKATQAELLTQTLKQQGQAVMQVSFPDYESDSSALVRMYLSGELGRAGEVNPYAASSFYAADRFVSFQKNWKKHYEAGHTIVCDRYTTSNAAHQMPKLPKSEWDSYLHWMEDYEYHLLALPKPDRVLYLDMHPDTSRALIRSRYRGDSEKMDIHEEDLAYLSSCRQTALYAADKLGWTRISCDKNNTPRPISEIAKEILQALHNNLPA